MSLRLHRSRIARRLSARPVSCARRCSGQSNMEFSVNTAFNATAEIEDSINYPHLRLATLQKAVANSPQPDAVSKSNYSWARSGPDAFVSTTGPGFSWFSATCCASAGSRCLRHA